MDQENITFMLTLFVFLNIPVLALYIYGRRHSALLPWKSYPLCFLIVHGTAFVAGLLLGNVVESTYNAMNYILHDVDSETSAMAAKAVVSLMAVAASLSAFCVIRKNFAQR
jgi:hypothetical protein